MSSLRMAILNLRPGAEPERRPGCGSCRKDSRQRMRRDHSIRSVTESRGRRTHEAEMRACPALAGGSEHSVDGAMPRGDQVSPPAHRNRRRRGGQSIARHRAGSFSDSARRRDIRRARLGQHAGAVRRAQSAIAPVPSPCIARAKSARPSCHAKVSRARHTRRESIGGASTAAPATAASSRPAWPRLRTSARHAPSTS